MLRGSNSVASPVPLTGGRLVSTLSLRLTWPSAQATLLGIFLLATGLRLLLALTHPGFMGVDGGAYLISQNQALGVDITGNAQPHPPLAPGFLLVPFTALWGNEVGLKLFAVIASLLPALPVYLLARRFLPPWPTTLAVGFLLVDWLHAEMFEAGALPFVGFTFITLALLTMTSLAQRFSWRATLGLAFCIPMIAFTNQTSTGIALFVFPVYLGALMFFRARQAVSQETGALAPLPRILPGLALGGAVALLALPWYVSVAPGTDIVRFPGPLLYLASWGSSPWWQLALTAPVGYWTARYALDHRLKALGVVTLLLAFLNVVSSSDEALINIFFRSGYLVAIPFYICIAWIVWRYWWPACFRTIAGGRLAMAGLVIMIPLITAGYIYQFYNQGKWTDRAVPTTITAIEYLQEKVPGQPVITSEFSLANYVAGINGTPAYWTTMSDPPPAWAEMDSRVRCVFGWREDCDPVEEASRLGANFLLVDIRFPNEQMVWPIWAPLPEKPWEVTAQAPWLQLVYSEGPTRLWQVKDP